MLVMKFGGTSVADAGRMQHVAGLVTPRDDRVVVVTSAMGGVTDTLLELAELARAKKTDRVRSGMAVLRDRHLDAAGALAGSTDRGEAMRGTIERMLGDLDDLLHGVSLVQEVSPRSRDLISSFGERLAVPLVAEAIAARGAAAVPVDARDLILTARGFSGDDVDMERSRTRTRDRLLPLAAESIPVVTGFIASSADGHTTTLGRGGSDYTATLIGSFLDAGEIWIWTDVDGVMTADPRIVPEARLLPTVTYREAAEMAYFGSRVLHPRTMIPAVQARIPVVIRNSLAPDRPGTRITDEPVRSALGVKTVTSVRDLALVTVEGNGMMGVPGVAKRVFATTAAAGINVDMVSQASSEHNISIVVRRQDGRALVHHLEREFEPEISRREIDRVDVIAPVGIVAAIGEGMKGTPGISQRFFTALGRGRINVLAIAQGSSELNLSVAVDEDDLDRAVGAVHSRFGLTLDTHLFILGKGLVGSALLGQIVAARPRLGANLGMGLKVIGVSGRSEMVFDVNGLADRTLESIAGGAALSSLDGATRPTDAEWLDRIAQSRWLDVVVVDVTAEDNADLHAAALRHGFHVVTANKKPMSGPMSGYRAILDESAAHGASYHYETTFGAGLPALSTLQDLVATCDIVHRVTGCFSGTLGYICSELHAGRRFSEIVREARGLGYTEPDPRDDLSGLDVARKALIISRALGGERELADVAIEGMIPGALADVDGVDDFLDRLPEVDDEMARRVDEAECNDTVLRYVAEITPADVRVGLRAVARDHPAGQLSGPDNILVYETERYRANPLVIRGPGAGAEVTAAGVLGDILKIVRAS